MYNKALQLYPPPLSLLPLQPFLSPTPKSLAHSATIPATYMSTALTPCPCPPPSFPRLPLLVPPPLWYPATQPFACPFISAQFLTKAAAAGCEAATIKLQWQHASHRGRPCCIGSGHCSGHSAAHFVGGAPQLPAQRPGGPTPAHVLQNPGQAHW